MRPEYLELLKAGFSLSIALITLCLGWFIGHRLTLKWNLIQKQRETDIANLQQFYLLYGEFKEVSKVWRVIKRNQDPNLAIEPNTRWSLLTRACAVESENEAIVVKLATEQDLRNDDLRALGLFRQALQKLRESIRDDVELPSSSRGVAYVFFNELATKVGSIISSSRTVTTWDPNNASKRLDAIASVRLPDFEKELRSFAEAHPEFSQ